VAKDKITREEAEAHDAEVREWLKSKAAADEDRYTVMLALGYALPERRLSPAARKQLQKRADKIIRSALIKHLKGDELEFNMRRLALAWLEQQGRGRGRPSKNIQAHEIRQAIWDEYRKHEAPDPKVQRILDEIGKRTGLRITPVPKRPMHKQIIGDVGDRIGLGTERMKQLVPRGPDPVAEIDKAIGRITKKPRRK
jgi:hypothetical protein